MRKVLSRAHAGSHTAEPPSEVNKLTDCSCTRGRMLTRLVRQVPLNLLVALALVSALAVGLFTFFAVPAYAQSGMPSVSVTTLQTRMQEGDQALFTVTRSGGDMTQPLTARIYSFEPSIHEIHLAPTTGPDTTT